MGDREILLVETDSKVRTQMADSFRREGYRVDTAESTADLLGILLEKQMPVVLLGSGSDSKIALARLVPLLKECSRGVSIILVSDEEALPTFRSIRQEGIFYHALKPTGREDTEEILAAVACAFNRTASMERKLTDHAACPETAPEPAVPCAALSMPEQAPAGIPGAVSLCGTEESPQGERKTDAKAAPLLSALGIALAALVYYCATATAGVQEGSHPAVWAFLAFFALIVVCRLLPACFSGRAAGKAAAGRLQDDLAAGRQRQDSIDKN